MTNHNTVSAGDDFVIIPDTGENPIPLLMEDVFNRKYAARLEQGMSSSDALSAARQETEAFEHNLLGK